VKRRSPRVIPRERVRAYKVAGRQELVALLDFDSHQALDEALSQLTLQREAGHSLKLEIIPLYPHADFIEYAKRLSGQLSLNMGGGSWALECCCLVFKLAEHSVAARARPLGSWDERASLDAYLAVGPELLPSWEAFLGSQGQPQLTTCILGCHVEQLALCGPGDLSWTHSSV